MAAISVLLAAGGASWEAAAMSALRPPAVVVLKRCVDLPDLLATATTGQSDVAVVDAGLPGLDTDAVATLSRWGVRVVSVGERDLTGIGIAHRVAADALETLGGAVAAAAKAERIHDQPSVDANTPTPPQRGRIVAVWGARGAPGRTTVAVALAAARASLGERRVVLADLDPFGGAVAQHLGVLDEASGLLAAARLVNRGTLTAASFAQTRRSVETGLEILTGLPRADRWIEVRPGAVEAMLRLAAVHADVVADCGSCLEEDEDAIGPGRHVMTLEALRCADEIVAVGVADAVGLSRLARALAEVQAAVPGATLRVVVNRHRETLGWSPAEVVAMVERFVRPASIDVLPDDPGCVDRAMLLAEPVRAGGDSALGRGLADLMERVFADSDPGPTPSRRWRSSRSRARVGRRTSS